MVKRRQFRHKTIAMIYDFDGTLTPQPMRGVHCSAQTPDPPSRFWRTVKDEAKRTGGDEMLTYMRLLIKKLEEQEEHLSRNDLRRLGKRIEYFPGVLTWFDRIAGYVAERGEGVVTLENYIISAGNKELLDGIVIRGHFKKIFASEYFFDHHDRATFPNILVNDTIKTQYIFRVNKGLDAAINEYMPEDKRRIPFANIVYVGDGMTDVPGMTVTKKNGGYAVAVHRPRAVRSIDTCKRLLKAERIDFLAPADYSAGKVLERRVKLILDEIIAGILYRRELFKARLAAH